MEIEGVKLRKKYYFIDESGDPNVCDKKGNSLSGQSGYQPYFILGMVEAFDRKTLRDKVMGFMRKIRKDVLYNAIPSIAENPEWFVHARQDHPEVRINFIELLRKLKSINTRVLIVRKDKQLLGGKKDGKASSLYVHALERMLYSKNFEKDLLHVINVSQFGNNQFEILKHVIAPLEQQGIRIELQIVSSKSMPEISIIDYMLWMVHRKLVKGETRFFNALRDKYGVIIEI